MTQAEQTKNAKNFAEYWKDKGDEKQETSRYWIELLQEVLGIENPSRYIEFEKRVKREDFCHPELDSGTKDKEIPKQVRNDNLSLQENKIIHTNFIDGYISSTKVLIEQKGSKIDLTKPQEQSDGAILTPYQQAKRYADELPYDLRPRWIVVSNFQEIHIHDMNNPHAEPEIIKLANLEKEYYRLQFLVDEKNEKIRREEEISLQAGILVGKLYDALIKEYWQPSVVNEFSKENSHVLSAFQLRSLNILCVRLVFCLYAEDAGFFETRTCFEDYIKSHSVQNLRKALIDLFKGLDTKLENRDKYDTSLKPFPYVNGGLFAAEDIEIPNFTQEIVDVLVNDCATFDWREISPTIFGAVFESTLNPETRRTGGMHYTSIENIHKVIDPLFMDELTAEFEAICDGYSFDCNSRHPEKQNRHPEKQNRHPEYQTSHPEYQTSHPELVSGSINKEIPKQVRNDKKLSPKQRIEALHAFQEKLGNLKFLDPACGSGNFLTETYLSLRRLENKVITILSNGEKLLGFDEFIKVKINQFYGIEINDFAVTVAKTALWIAESQMIQETEKILSQAIDFFPLTTNAFIVEGNALRMDWSTLKPIDETVQLNDGLFAGFATELDGGRIEWDYIMGNPPFVGYKLQNEKQKLDLEPLFGKIKTIDYVAGWYVKASQLIQNTNIRCAFVSTNSICQGEQVPAVWKLLTEKYNINIDFAYQTFKWESEAVDMAHVHVVIVGFCCHTDSENLRFSNGKRIFDSNGSVVFAKNINPYLVDAPNVFIEKRSKPICEAENMIYGSEPREGGFLILNEDERQELINETPESQKIIKRFVSSEDFINNKIRYCLWFSDEDLLLARKSKILKERLENCRKFREESKQAQAHAAAVTPHLFSSPRQPNTDYLLIPIVSSERRKYIPIGYMPKDIILSNACFSIPNASLYTFGILTSSMHMAWMRTVAGRLKSDYRYSNTIVYNNFVWCNPTEEQKAKIEQTAQTILDVRAKYQSWTLADLYDELTMPPALRKAHQENDKAVEKAYGESFKTDDERVAFLFEKYVEMTK